MSKLERPELLLQLAELMEADAKNKKGIKFDLSVWGITLDENNNPMDLKGKSVPLDCRTSACALGLAAISGAFKEQGLGYNVSNDGWIYPTLTTDRKMAYDQDAFSVGAKVFGISVEQSQYLFDPDMYLDAQEGAKGERFVAKRIRELVANDGEMTQPTSRDEDL